MIIIQSHNSNCPNTTLVRVVALVVSVVLASVHPPATIIILLIVATVAQAQLMGNDDTVLQLSLLSSYREMLLTVFHSSYNDRWSGVGYNGCTPVWSME